MGATQPVIRIATREDLPGIVRLLADDKLGAAREDAHETLNNRYVAAFNDIVANAGNDLVVMEQDGDCVGCLQIMILPGFDRLGARRAFFEGLRIAMHLRGQGHGRALLQWAIEHARQKKCEFVQLAVNKNRSDAIRFYETLGFTCEHEGMKYSL